MFHLFGVSRHATLLLALCVTPGCLPSEADDVSADGEETDASVDPAEQCGAAPDAGSEREDFGAVAPFDATPAPDAAPEPEPSVGCEGRFALASWVVVDSGFDASYFNTFLADALANGSLALSVVTLADPDGPAGAMTLSVTQVGPDGLPLAGAPAGEDLQVTAGPNGALSTRAPGIVAFHVQGRILNYDVDMDARFENATWTGRFADDCSFMGGRLEAAFSAAGLSLPVDPDTDLDGDGTPDAYFMGSNLQALRVP